MDLRGPTYRGREGRKPGGKGKQGRGKGKGKSGRGEEQDFRAFLQFQICHYTTDHDRMQYNLVC